MRDKEIVVAKPSETIKEILRIEKISQTDLAEKMGISRQNVNQLLNRNRVSIRFDSLQKITETLGYEILLRKK